VKRRELRRVRRYADLPARPGAEFTGDDLLLAPKEATTTWLPPGWRVLG
jgi:hypothetical protein